MRKRVDRLLWTVMASLVLIILALAGCGGGGEQSFVGDGGGEEPEPIVQSSTTVLVNAAQGATIRLDDSSVTIPPNALTKDAEVTVSLLDRPGLRPRNESFEPSGSALEIETEAAFRDDFEGEIQVEFQGGEGDLIVLTRDDGISTTLQINDPVNVREVRAQLGALKNLAAKVSGFVVKGAKKVVVAAYKVVPKPNSHRFITNSSWQRVSGGRYAVVLHGINSSAEDQRIGSLARAIESFGLYNGVARFQYDFTQGPEAPARQLADDLRTLPADAKVDIYAHSFGGLVSRYYLQRVDAGNSKVQRLFTLGTPHEGAGLDGGTVSKLAPILTDEVLNVVTGLKFGWVWRDNDPTVQWLLKGNSNLKALNVPGAVQATVPHPFCIAGDKHPILLGVDDYSISAALVYGPVTRNDGIVGLDSARATSVFGTIPTYQHRTARLNHSELLADREIHRVLEQEARRNLGVGGSTGTGGGTDGGGTDGGGDGGTGTGGDDGGGDGGTPPPGDFTIERVSIDSIGGQGNEGSSNGVSVSADGRYVAFSSSASNLVPNDTNGEWDIFVHDRQTGATTRASVDSTGAQSNGSSSYNPRISADGRFVTFSSWADNLVANDTNGVGDIFVHDRQTSITTRVSVGSTGVQSNGNSSSADPDDLSISADGRYVAFSSSASNLVPNDTNGEWDIFVHDRQTGVTTRVSIDSTGVQGQGHGGGTGSHFVSISADGRYVAFASENSNLVEGDTNGVGDVFVHDRQTGVTTRVNVNSTGVQANRTSFSIVSISADGRYVAFSSSASNLVPNDTNGEWDIFVHDRQTGVTTRVSIDSTGVQGHGGGSGYLSISADGRYVAFSSSASNLVPNDTNGEQDTFVHDRQTGVTTRVSIDSTGVQANSNSFNTSISADGRYVAFYSLASNLVPDDTNDVSDVFVARNPLAP